MNQLQSWKVFQVRYILKKYFNFLIQDSFFVFGFENTFDAIFIFSICCLKTRVL